MNWTGGGLSRSKATGTLTARQKQHFAKVQTNLHAGWKPKSSTKWSIFSALIGDHRQQSASLEPSRGHSHRSQLKRPQQSSHRRESTRQRSESAEHQGAHSHEHRPHVIKEEPVSDDDLYDATPEPPKRKRDVSIAEPDEINGGDQHEDLISEKKRRLLQKADWVGMAMQRPTHFSYISPRQDERVGRRRKVTDGHKARYNSKHTIASPFASKVRGYSPRALDSRHAQARGDVRISIGGRVVATGISSSSAPSQKRGNPSHSQLVEQSRIASSDVMLLDNEDVLSTQCRRGNYDQSVDNPKRSGHYAERSSNRDKDGRPKRLATPHILNLDRIRNLRTVGESHSPSQLRSSASRSISQQQPDTPHPTTRHTIGTNIYQQGGTIFSSSSISIHHPKPQSSRVSTLLNSGSSDIARSTSAQIGMAKPVVPSSQILDNEIWETWMGPLFDDKDTSEANYRLGDSKRVSISPGISAAPFKLHHSRHTMPPRHSSAFSNQESTGLQDHEDRVSEVMYSSPAAPVHESPQKRRTRRQAKLNHTWESVRPQAGRVLRSPPRQPGREVIEPRACSSKPQKEPNPDEIWRKFVFGGSSDEAEGESEGIVDTGVQVKAVADPECSMNDDISEKSSFGSRAAVNNSDIPASLDHSAWDSLGGEAQNSDEADAADSRDAHEESPQDGLTSIHACVASYSRSSSNGNVASEGAIPSSESVASASTHTGERQRKARFTRPKPFISSRSTEKEPAVEEEPVHVRRGLLNRAGTKGETKAKKDRHIYSLVDSDESI